MELQSGAKIVAHAGFVGTIRGISRGSVWLS